MTKITRQTIKEKQLPTTPFTFGNLKDKAKFVMAELPYFFEMNGDAESLTELCKRKGMHHAASLTGLKGKLAKRYFDTHYANVGINYNQVYLLPLHALHFPTDTQHGRVIATKDDARVWTFKGIGNRSKFRQDKTSFTGVGYLGKIKVLGKYYNPETSVNAVFPFEELYDEGGLGSISSNQIQEEKRNYKEFKKGHEAFKQKEPKLFASLGAPEDAPFAKPVATFRILEAVGRAREKTKGSKIVRTPIYSHTTHKLVLVKENPFSNTRIDEVTGYPYPNRCKEFAHKLATHYNIDFEEELNPDNKLELLYKIQSRLLVIFHVARSYSKLALHQNETSLLGANVTLHEKDFNGVNLFDLQGLTPASKENLPADIRNLHLLDGKIRKWLNLPHKYNIESHPHYEKVVESARRSV